MREPISIDLFAGIPKPRISLIEGLGRVHEFSPSETIVRSTESANRLFLIKTGHVDYYINTDVGRDVLLRRLIPGDVFGFGAFFSNPAGYLGTAIACSRSRTLVWSSEVVRRVAQDYPKFMENALRIAFLYFQIELQRHASLVTNTAQGRLALALVRLGARVGQTLGGGVEVLVSNEKLASLADVNTYTASRTLKAWEREGTLTKSYGRVVITSPERLLSYKK